MAVLGDRRDFLPFGVLGGKPAAGADVVFGSREGEFRLPFVTKGRRNLARGEVVEYLSPGGGGYGDPLERDPERVLRDAVLGYISREQAREDYGVVLEPRAGSDGLVSWTLDRTATTALRAALPDAPGAVPGHPAEAR